MNPSGHCKRTGCHLRTPEQPMPAGLVQPRALCTNMLSTTRTFTVLQTTWCRATQPFPEPTTVTHAHFRKVQRPKTYSCHACSVCAVVSHSVHTGLVASQPQCCRCSLQPTKKEKPLRLVLSPCPLRMQRAQLMTSGRRGHQRPHWRGRCLGIAPNSCWRRYVDTVQLP